MSGPADHPVIPGSNGLRKLRFSAPGSHQGKRGSYRVYYAYFDAHGIVLLMAIIAKNAQSDLNKADVKALGGVLSRVKTLFDQGIIR